MTHINLIGNRAFCFEVVRSYLSDLRFQPTRFAAETLANWYRRLAKSR